jgi:hypothetical protein
MKHSSNIVFHGSCAAGSRPEELSASILTADGARKNAAIPLDINSLIDSI